jgi:hypothetical protein
MDRFLFKPPNFISKSVATISSFSFLIALLGGAYGFSIEKDKIDDKIFTISQALAFGNKYIMVVFFTIAFAGIFFLNFYRTPRNLLIPRIILLIFVYGFLITIIWVTTFVDKELHYIFAGIIFTSNLIYITLITYIYQKYLTDKAKYKTYMLDLNLMLAFASMVILLVFGIFEANENSKLDDAIFASNENFTVLLTIITLLFLGFI